LVRNLGINALGTSETEWSGEDDYKRYYFRIIHPEDENQRGEAVILDKRNSQLCGNVRCKCDRLLRVKVTGKPVDMCIIQLYMPTMEHSEKTASGIAPQT